MMLIERLLEEESAQGMTEYAILIATLALGAIVILVALGTKLKNVFQAVQTQINTVPSLNG